ncbi:hypothetical protein AWB82_02924 [Caballeronia glebae]|jgi:hypothetical protein|uniref:DUF3331 domain-containing protein n=1 Tax=Caballeronia glebae TaxID=1777143 RepID=A0A158ASQ5_9BURK|nr:DUF3331 domain-containing protein [Caballeronia glebae]SAK60988.1 hypothetical protein AWB82_02924 [Caballeronia glebae]
MHRTLNFPDPWSQIIVMLNGRANAFVASTPRQFPRERTAIPTGVFDRAPMVDVVERPTSTTATIYWRDATCGCYGHQTWRTSRARAAGVCAMSGKRIAPGDLVYRPSSRSSVCNGHSMILASVLESGAPV